MGYPHRHETDSEKHHIIINQYTQNRGMKKRVVSIQEWNGLLGSDFTCSGTSNFWRMRRGGTEMRFILTYMPTNSSFFGNEMSLNRLSDAEQRTILMSFVTGIATRRKCLHVQLLSMPSHIYNFPMSVLQLQGGFTCGTAVRRSTLLYMICVELIRLVCLYTLHS